MLEYVSIKWHNKQDMPRKMGQVQGVNWKWVKKQSNPKTNIKGPVESLENYKSRPLLKNSQSLAPWKQTI